MKLRILTGMGIVSSLLCFSFVLFACGGGGGGGSAAETTSSGTVIIKTNRSDASLTLVGPEGAVDTGQATMTADYTITIANLPQGLYTVTFNDLAACTTTPAADSGTLVGGRTLTLEGDYAGCDLVAVGKVRVEVNNPYAAYVIYGPAGLTKSGVGNAVYNDLPIGGYNIVFSAVGGCNGTPAGQSKTLAEGETVVFNGVYETCETVAHGIIRVNTNQNAAAFTVSGPVSYSGSGTAWEQTLAPTGVYTVTYTSVSGLLTPAPETKTLSSGGTIAFNAVYQTPAANSINVNITRGAYCLGDPSFSISGPAAYTGSGRSWSVNNAAPGTYTITFNNLGVTSAAPTVETQTLTAGGSIIFNAAYNCAISTWSKTYGGTGPDEVDHIVQTAAGYVLAGITGTFGGGSLDFWWVQLDAQGKIAVEKAYGGFGSETLTDFKPTSDGGYILGGYTTSFGAGGTDGIAIKLDADGDVVWQKVYGTAADEGFKALKETSDGNFIAAGFYNSDTTKDAWVLKLNADGNILWQKRYTWDRTHEVYDLELTSDGGFVLVGGSNSFTVTEDYQGWILKLDRYGNVLWANDFGGNRDEFLHSVRQTADSGYIIVGETASFGAGGKDIWALRLNSNGQIVWQKTYGGAGDETPSAVSLTPATGGYLVSGITSSFSTVGNDGWMIKLDDNGYITWQKTFGGGGSDSILDVAPDNNGGYIACGGNGSSGAGNTDFWFLKLDMDGAAGAACASTLGAVTSIVPKKTNATPDFCTVNAYDTAAATAGGSVVTTVTYGKSNMQCHN